MQDSAPHASIFDAAAIARALKGALALLGGRSEALKLFDLSIGGFWRSFAAILVAAPFYALDVATEQAARAAAEPAPDLLYYVVKTLAYLVDWLAFPLLVAVLAGPFGFGRLYVPYIVAYNWSSVWIAALFAPPALLVGLGFMGREAAGLVSLALVVIAARYRFVIARIALQAPPATALGLVVLELLLSLLVVQLFGRLAM